MTNLPARHSSTPPYLQPFLKIVALALVTTLLWLLVVVSIAAVRWAEVDGVTAGYVGLCVLLLAIGVAGLHMDRRQP